MLPTMSLSVELMKTNQRRGTLEAVAGRLQVAMAYRRMTITELQAALEQASVVGSRYSNVQRYVRGKCGKSPPPFIGLRAQPLCSESLPLGSPSGMTAPRPV